jgi:hypothetical protein
MSSWGKLPDGIEVCVLFTMCRRIEVFFFGVYTTRFFPKKSVGYNPFKVILISTCEDQRSTLRRKIKLQDEVKFPGETLYSSLISLA